MGGRGKIWKFSIQNFVFWCVWPWMGGELFEGRGDKWRLSLRLKIYKDKMGKERIFSEERSFKIRIEIEDYFKVKILETRSLQKKIENQTWKKLKFAGIKTQFFFKSKFGDLHFFLNIHQIFFFKLLLFLNSHPWWSIS